jgi:cytochrome c553
MRWRDLLDWRRIALTAGALTAIAIVAAAIFVFTGIYNVSARRDHFAVVTALLALTRERSIDARSARIDAPDLAADGMVELGAAHFEGGCAICHPRPGKMLDAIAQGMLPRPVPLSRGAAERPASELFWIVKNGLKYTGMPSWPGERRDDEVWAVAAFIKHLGKQPTPDYARLAGLTRLPAERRNAQPLEQCGRCHDAGGLGTHGGLVPVLSGQREDYLRRALQEYAEGVRPSGIMEPVADALSPQEIDALAAHFSAATPVEATLSPDVESIARGEKLATAGDHEGGVPPCLACHSDNGARMFPRLAGQNAAYVAGQLRLWQNGGRDSTSWGKIMSVVAKRLNEQQIDDVAAYFASLAGNPNTGDGQARQSRTAP